MSIKTLNQWVLAATLFCGATVMTSCEDLFGSSADNPASPTETTSTETTSEVSLATLTADYTAKDGDILTGTLPSGISLSIADGATVTFKGVTVKNEKGIECGGTATIILADGTTNSITATGDGQAALQAGPSGKTLTIKGETAGTGKLTATGAANGAGIGSDMNGTCGNISISGGDITAKAGDFGSGIGSGRSAICGNISISGGTVSSTGGTQAAGIGTGISYDQDASCGNISISGGTVSATCSGNSGAGIGTGDRISNTNKCGNISISGGTVKAQGGSVGTGAAATNDVGKGAALSTVGTITIGDGISVKKLDGTAADIYKPDATVSATPAATTGDVKAGSTTALISAGTVTGGTMMYKVTTENTKPTTTDGFSSTVPTAKELAAGTYYVWYYVKGDAEHADSEISSTAITVTVKSAEVAKAAKDVTSADKGKVIGTDGKIYTDAAAATAANTTAVAKVIYVGSNTGHDTYNHGLALALADEDFSEMWNDAKTDCSKKTAVTNAVWMLPSQEQWETMASTDGAGSWAALGSSYGLGNHNYWTSTKVISLDSVDEYAYNLEYWDSEHYWGKSPLDNFRYVRAVLAF